MDFVYTTELSGSNERDNAPDYKIVTEFGSRTLESALDTLKSLPSSCTNTSCIVFRKVCPPLEIDEQRWTDLENQMRSFESILSLEVLKKSLLYKKNRRETIRCSPKQRREMLAGIDDTTFFDDDFGKVDTENTRQYIEEFFHRAEKNSDAVYYYNASNPLEGVPRVLDNIESHISEKFNPNVGEMIGINQPMFYLGRSNSFTEVHVEDGLLDSINILRSGAPKVWIIIDRRSYLSLNKCLNKDLYGIPSYGKDVCPLPVQHKDTVVTPRYLDENNIKYEFVVQYPGDMLFIRTGAAHQVWNVGRNLAEAVNYGSDEWNFSSSTAFMCSCPKTSLVPIESNTFAQSKIVPRVKRKVFECPEKDCHESYRSRTELNAHRTACHGMEHRCPICSECYAHRPGLSRHLKNWHGKNLNEAKEIASERSSNDGEDVHGARRRRGGHSAENMRNRTRKACNICRRKYVDLRTHQRTAHEMLN